MQGYPCAGRDALGVGEWLVDGRVGWVGGGVGEVGGGVGEVGRIVGEGGLEGGGG